RDPADTCYRVDGPGFAGPDPVARGGHPDWPRCCSAASRLSSHGGSIGKGCHHHHLPRSIFFMRLFIKALILVAVSASPAVAETGQEILFNRVYLDARAERE